MMVSNFENNADGIPADFPDPDVTDQRRPGRPARVAYELLPLLRYDAATVDHDDFDNADKAGLGLAQAIRSLIIVMAVSIALWATLFLIGRWLLEL